MVVQPLQGRWEWTRPLLRQLARHNRVISYSLCGDIGSGRKTDGGFDDYVSAEDWPLWIKAWIAGASMKLSPQAVYRQHWRPGSRNQLEYRKYQEICQHIRDKYTPLARAAGLA